MLTLSAFLGISSIAAPAGVMAATEHWNDAADSGSNWETYKKNWSKTSSNLENVSLTPGKTESELNFAWYSKTAETPKVRIAQNEYMLNVPDKYADQIQEFSGTQTNTDEEGYYSNKVTVTGLKENTDYYYQVYQDGQWQSVKSYSTHSWSQYSFLYVGDPQIGACTKQTSDDGTAMSESEDNYAARNDSFNWNSVLTNALIDHPDVSFMLSAGDQVNTGNSEAEYAGYLSADALTSLPVSTTIGNHDSPSAKYTYHFNNPNSFSETDTKYTEGKTNAGTDYYYTYGNVLFIVLDTNNYNCATHKNVIAKAVSENKDAKWRVVMFHQDIYGSGKDHSDSDGIVLRTQLTPIMDEYDIDVVLQGHDHTYSRSYQLKGDGKSHTSYDKSNYKSDTEYLNQNICYDITTTQTGTVTNPEGTVYFEANSATGSKFYQLIATKQDYIAERSQQWTPTYSVVSVSDTKFTVTTYDAKTRKELKGSSTYTIVKDSSSDKKNDTKTDDTKTNDKKTDNNKKNTGSKKQTASAALKKSVILKAKASGKKTVKVTWKKDKNASGYQVVYSYKKNFKSKVKKVYVKKNTKTSKVLTKLKKKKLYIKVRSYKTVNGKKVFGAYSKVKKVTVK